MRWIPFDQRYIGSSNLGLRLLAHIVDQQQALNPWTFRFERDKQIQSTLTYVEHEQIGCHYPSALQRFSFPTCLVNPAHSGDRFRQ
jgi:hypothetical protein